MSSVTITFYKAGGRLGDLRDAPVMSLGDGMVSEVITSGAGSTQSTLTSPHDDREGFVRVCNIGANDIAVAAAANPTAVAAGPKVFHNSQEDFHVRKGDKIAIIDV